MEDIKSENKPPKWSLLRQNNETGEIVDLNRPFKNGFEIMVERKQRENDSLVKLNLNKGRVLFSRTNDCQYNSVYIDKIRQNPFGKNALFRGYLDILRDRLCAYTNALCHEKDYVTQPLNPMSTTDLIQYLEISKAQFYKFFKEAKERGVLCEVTYDTNGKKKTAILVNPAYAHRTVELSWEVCRAFSDDKVFKSILKEWHIEQIERVNTEIKYLK